MTVANWIQEAYERKTWLMTRGGDKRRVICVDRPSTFPVVCMCERGELHCLYEDGTLVKGADCLADLLPPKRQFDVCVIEHSCGEICIVRMSDAPRFREVGSKILARATIAEGSGCG